jgi:hypothetical protein
VAQILKTIQKLPIAAAATGAILLLANKDKVENVVFNKLQSRQIEKEDIPLQ